MLSRPGNTINITFVGKLFPNIEKEIHKVLFLKDENIVETSS